MADRSLRNVINPTAKQDEFFKLMREYDYLLYGGAAGGGKSYSLRWALVVLLMEWYQKLGLKNVRAGLFCETFPALHDRHLSKVRYEFPEWLGTPNEQSHEFRLRPEHGGGVIAFRNLDDSSKYMSVEFGAVAVDELTRNDKQVFHDLVARMRWPGVERPKFLGGTNPGQKGHLWVKKLWIDRDFSGDDDKLMSEQFRFLPARVDDNPHISESYVRTLDQLPEAMRRALKDGDWDTFSGQYFGEYRRNLHVITPFEVPDYWNRWRSIDYGTANPWCTLFLTQDPTNGRRYVYRELYAKGLTAREQAQILTEVSGNERYLFTRGDPSMFNRTNDNGTSPADSYREMGVSVQPARNDRVRGWNSVREALRLREDGWPGIQFFDTCRNLIRTLPALPYAEHNPEDLDTDAEDHAADALRYGLSLAAVSAEARKPKKPARNPWGSAVAAR